MDRSGRRNLGHQNRKLGASGRAEIEEGEDRWASTWNPSKKEVEEDPQKSTMQSRASISTWLCVERDDETHGAR